MALHNIQKFFVFLICNLSISQAVSAKSVMWCVYDITGDVAQIMKDYAIQTQQWDIETKFKVYTDDQEAIKDFKNKHCDAVVASNFITRKYNAFMGTLGAVGLIPNNQVAQQVFLALGEPYMAKYMIQNNYENVGWMPIGFAYFMVKDRSINSISQLTGRRLGVMREDPSQERMARRVGAIPKYINFQNAAAQFINNEIDVLPAPIYAYQPFELQKGLGYHGGVINFPVSYVSLNFIIRRNVFPKNYGQLSRNWFTHRTPRMMQNVLRWEQAIPKKYWYDLPISERQSYQRIVAQLRREFISARIYHYDFVKLVLSKHCENDEQYFECKK